MPVFLLDSKDHRFPDPMQADPEGLIAVGGDLSPERLLSAYSIGIYPCYGPDNPILWWSPDPRPIILPQDLRLSSRLLRALRHCNWRLTLDTAFEAVIDNCALAPRPAHSGVWLLPEIKQAYTALHHLGFAHSVELWENDDLVGGLYGVSLGKAFFGESMFHKKNNASKIALICLCKILEKWEFHFIDCQQASAHTSMLGAASVPRAEFMRHLGNALHFHTKIGYWNAPENFTLQI